MANISMGYIPSNIRNTIRDAITYYFQEIQIEINI